MKKATNYRIVFITVDSYNGAHHLAKVLINEKLAACTTIIPSCFSVFSWNDKIEERNEFLMMVKTTEEKLEGLESRVKEIHSDQVPEILAVSVEEGFPAYLDWISDSLKDSQ